MCVFLSTNVYPILSDCYIVGDADTLNFIVNRNFIEDHILDLFICTFEREKGHSIHFSVSSLIEGFIQTRQEAISFLVFFLPFGQICVVCIYAPDSRNSCNSIYSHSVEVFKNPRQLLNNM